MCIFLQPRFMNDQYFEWTYTAIWLLILCFFDLGICQGDFIRFKQNFNRLFIVSSRVGTPPPPSFWNKFKKLSTSFWEPSKLVHVIVKNTLESRRYLLYYTKSIENIINITIFTFRLNWHFLCPDIAFNAFHVWYARAMNMKHF